MYKTMIVIGKGENEKVYPILNNTSAGKRLIKLAHIRLTNDQGIA